LRAIDQQNRGGAGGGERAPDLENEDGVGVALAIQNERSGQLRRRRKTIDAGDERLPTQILAGLDEIAWLTGEIEVGSGGINLSLSRDRIGLVYGPKGHDPRWKAGDRAPR
jgi:hypothetical protein